MNKKLIDKTKDIGKSRSSLTQIIKTGVKSQSTCYVEIEKNTFSVKLFFYSETSW